MFVDVTKVGQGHPKLRWCNASITSIKLQIWSLYLTSRRCSGKGNVEACHEVPKIRDNFAPYISKIASRTRKVSMGANIPDPSTIKVVHA